MDLDDLEAPSKVPSRVSRFAPKSTKLKPKPKSEPPPKPEPEPLPSFSKPEPQEFDVTVKKNEDRAETVSSSAHAKPEPNGAVKMDVEPKSEAGDDPMDEDRSEDTVVREIDVFFSPSIDANTQLYVFQYPLRPSWRPYELDEQCQEVRLKRGNSEMEIDLSVDLESSNIDKEFANKYNITKQTLSTTWKPPCSNGCAVGLLMGDKLHLLPINAVVQLRPSLQHFKSDTLKRKNTTSAGANATVKIEAPVEEKSVAASKKQNKQTEPSVGQKSDGDEGWVPLKYHSCKSDISYKYLQQMMVQEGSPLDFTMRAYDYVTALCPTVSSNVLPKGPSKRYLLSLPVEERLKKMLIEGRPLHRFSAIKHFAPEYSEEELLGFLQQHAILVWGLWTAKSALLYPQGGLEIMPRDYALLLFSQNLKVQLSHVNVRGELGNYVKNFLKTFGLERHDKDKSTGQLIPYWKFREVPDESFKKLYPNIVEKQEKLFKELEKQLPSFASSAGNRKLGKSAGGNRGVNNELIKSENADQQVRSLGGVPPVKMTMSTETRHALPIALRKLFQNHKVCSFQMICQELRAMAVSQNTLSKDYKIFTVAAHSLDGPHDELKAVISEVAYDIHGYYVLKSSQDDPFRDVVIDLLRGCGPDAKLKKADILSAARMKLNREVTNNEYTKVMSDLCVSKGSVWVLKSGDGSMK
ncbi:hypothetical protein RJT34_05867 [Clitoria ternatea]|uniref:DNA-directed RNA polymerase III subunit RPC5 n=1 Tax=Clitoria ternatea TaxID=43366 RepID=A0AAN9K1Y7_CLITE